MICIPELLQIIGSYLDHCDLKRASRVNKTWYLALKPLLHRECAIPFSGYILHPWLLDGEAYNDMYEGDVEDDSGEEDQSDWDPVKRMSYQEFKARRHWIRELQLGFFTFPLLYPSMVRRPHPLIRAFNRNLHSLLFSEDEDKGGPRASSLTNLRSLTVSLLPFSILLSTRYTNELFKFWDPRRRFVELPDTKIRKKIAHAWKAVTPSHPSMPIHIATWTLLQMNTRLSSLCVIQLSEFEEDNFRELSAVDQRTMFLGPELHMFLTSFANAPVFTQLTSLSLIKFEWPQHAITRFLDILREVTPNLRELTLVFRLYNNLCDLLVEDLTPNNADNQHPLLPLRYLHLSSFNPYFPRSLLEAVGDDAPPITFLEYGRQEREALFSLLRQFPRLEELHLTESDTRDRKGTLEMRSMLVTAHKQRICMPHKERSQCHEFNMGGDDSYSFFWYDGTGRAAPANFCRRMQEICPQLKVLDFSRFRIFRPPLMWEFLNTYGARLEGLDMFGNPGFDATALVQAVRICTNLTVLDISFCSEEYDLPFVDYGAPYAPFWEIYEGDHPVYDYMDGYESDSGTRLRSRSLEGVRVLNSIYRPHFRAIRPRYHITGREASLALWKLPHLKEFYAQGIPIDARDLLFQYDIAGWELPNKDQHWRVMLPSGDWACKNLEVLAINVMIPCGSPDFDDRDEIVTDYIAMRKFDEILVYEQQCAEEAEKFELQQLQEGLGAGSNAVEDENGGDGGEEDIRRQSVRSTASMASLVDSSADELEQGYLRRRNTAKRSNRRLSRLNGNNTSALGVTAREVRQYYQIGVCEQIGKLTRLRELLLEGKEDYRPKGRDETMGCLSLKIDMGLTALAPLAHTLERLCVPKLTEKLAGRAEVEWIANNLYRTSLSANR
ncbi:hypothetical protein BGW41_006283, partial [Actinomortierella wolfii]